MNFAGTESGGMRRLKLLCTLCLGASVPVLVGVLKELVFPWSAAAEPGSHRIVLWAMLLVLVAAGLVAYRVVRYSKVPGVPAIIGLLVLLWGLVLLSHFS